MSAIRRYLAVSFACVLIFSFGLHTFDTHHIHPGQVTGQHHHQESDQTDTGVLAEYAHSGEKKFFYVLLSFFAFACVTFAHRVTFATALAGFFLWRMRTALCAWRGLYCFEVHLFSSGILHPKLF